MDGYNKLINKYDDDAYGRQLGHDENVLLFLNATSRHGSSSIMVAIADDAPRPAKSLQLLFSNERKAHLLEREEADVTKGRGSATSQVQDTSQPAYKTDASQYQVKEA